MRSYDDVAMRWVARVLGHTTKPNYTNRRMPVDGDRIYSYGAHFELARLVRDKRGKPSHFLINGDRWPGVVTTRQQGIIRSAIGRTELPVVIIPHAALNACGIDPDSVQIVDVKGDWFEHGTIVSKEWPKGAKWEYERVTLEGTGGLWKKDDPFVRAEYGQWTSAESTYVHPVTKNTGRKVLRDKRYRQWELADDGEGGIEYRHHWERHRLGGSVIRAAVVYTVRTKCGGCAGTGQGEPWQNWRGETLTHCQECSGRGRVLDTRSRWAYFLSAFDSNETRPSYFLCELAPGVKPATYEEAIESLKPEAVKYAESIGRDVRRQGDIFAIPMPSLTLKELKKMGGVHEQRGTLLGTNHRATEVVRVGKHTYARGTLRHVPEFRRPDHKMVPLGRQWHLVQKNTVPYASGVRR